MATVLMRCGHSAQGEDYLQNPVCVICAGVKEGWDIPETDMPDLTGRQAACGDCGRLVDSSIELAFFRHQPEKERDSYYCGCHGWD